jgi:2-dehydropantoate 2-reductase
VGQVPKYIVVGRGRMASHFCFYLELLGISFVLWSRTDGTALSSVVGECERILLLISDDVIEDFVHSQDCLRDRTLIHFSGRLCSDVVIGAHPLMTFGPQHYALPLYQSIAFIIDDDAPAFSDLLPGLSNSHIRIPKNAKAFYHSLCVLGGNFTVLLWQKVFIEMEKLGISREMIYPYMQQIFANLHSDQNCLTGPLARGDRKTLEANIQALAGDPYQQVYRAFVNAYQETL